jgi:BASS family bile acid:Na+ symporter
MNTGLVSVGLPIALGITMLGLGIVLTPADFLLIIRRPKAGFVILAGQVVLLPVVGFGLITLLNLPPTDAAGLMLLVASPGGTTAGLFSYLAGGDPALNISLTAINTLLSIVTLPLVAGFALNHYLPAAQRPAAGLADFTRVIAIVVVPVLIGMALRRLAERHPRGLARIERIVRIGSIAVLGLTVAAAIAQQPTVVATGIRKVGLAALLLSIISLALGYWVPRALRISHRQSVSSTMELGIHNAVLAITIALSVLDLPALAFAPAAYAVVAFVPTGLLAYALRRRHRTVPAAVPTPSGID